MMKIAVLAVVGLVTGGLSLLWLTGEHWRLMRKSTWDNIKAHGWKDMLNFKSVHSYIYMRWQVQYMKATRWLVIHSDEGTRKKFADGYHAKVITHDQARAVITLNRNIPLRDLEQVIPYPTARELLLTGPPDVVVTECRCRVSLEHHCEPTQVCMMMGKPFTDFFLEHRPDITRRLDQAEALDLLRQTHELGLVHTAWFKDVMLNRMFSICNCCRCCCGGTNAMMKLGMPMLASSGYVSRIDIAKCDACGTCEKACHFEAIKVDKTAMVTWEKCMGCGVCEAKCPNDAVSLVRDEKKGIPFDVRVMV
jgi:ferredoxin